MKPIDDVRIEIHELHVLRIAFMMVGDLYFCGVLRNLQVYMDCLCDCSKAVCMHQGRIVHPKAEAGPQARRQIFAGQGHRLAERQLLL